jgi:hypothetical protein
MPLSIRPIHVAFVIALAAAVAAVAYAVSRIRGASAARDAAPAQLADSAPAGVASLGTAARSALDRGNAEYRAGRYESALAHYRAAAAAASASAAPWFGLFMAAKKLGNEALADSARAEMAKRVDTAAVMRAAPHPAVPKG